MSATRLMVTSVPQTETIFGYMRGNTAYDTAMRRVRSRLQERSKIEFDMVDVDIERLRNDVLEIVNTHGFSGWRHKDGESKRPQRHNQQRPSWSYAPS